LLARRSAGVCPDPLTITSLLSQQLHTMYLFAILHSLHIEIRSLDAARTVTNHTSSTVTIPDAARIPRHIAIIMDGNGRWAKQRFLPRVAGHRRGLEAVRATVKSCAERGVEYLTLFAFSSENWRRPREEVTFLMQLFVSAL